MSTSTEHFTAPSNLQGITSCFSDSSFEIRATARQIAEKDGHNNASLAVREALRAAATKRNLIFVPL